MSEQNQTIFGATPADQQVAPQVNAQPVQTVQPSAPVLPDEVAQFVGEGKKYRSIEDALKSVPHAQTHISTLEKELADAREQLAKTKAAEELLETLKAQQNVAPTSVPSVDTNQILTQVGSLVEKKLQETRAAEIAQSNQKAVVEALTAKFGDKAEAQYTAIAVASGLDVATLNSLAARSPQAVLKLAGIDSKSVEPATTKPASTINTEAFAAQPKQQQQVKGVMYGATTADVLSAWKAARPQL
jgi:hypothetical protein